MYCGICVEVCPFDALFWTPEFEYSEYRIEDLLHDKEKLQDWTYTVLPPPPLELGAEEEAEESSNPRRRRRPPRAPAAPASTAAAAPDAPATAEAPAAQADLPLLPRRPAGSRGARGRRRLRRVLRRPARRARPGDLRAGPGRPAGKGTDKRVAEGKAKSAAVLAARKKAEGGE